MVGLWIQLVGKDITLFLAILPLIFSFEIYICFTLKIFDVFELKSFQMLFDNFFVSVDVAVRSWRHVVHGLVSLHGLVKRIFSDAPLLVLDSHSILYRFLTVMNGDVLVLLVIWFVACTLI